MTASKILALVHHDPSDAGRAPWHLTQQGYQVEFRSAIDGDALPADLEPYAGVAIFGGIMGANDDHLSGIRAELDWIPDVIGAGCPLIGICLGAQLIARALGAGVDRHDDGVWEIGYCPVRPTAAGADFFSHPNPTFYQWHQDGFGLPEGAELLAQGNTFENQFFRYGANTYGLQFHPEVTSDLIANWMAASPDFERRPGAQDRQRQLDGAARHQADAEAWLGGFLKLWTGTGHAAGARRAAG